jgi:hypothetical protein
LLQVLLERGSGGDGFTGILILVGIGVAGIGHTSRSDVLVEGRGAAELGSRGEGSGRGDESGDEDELHGGWIWKKRRISGIM